MTTPPTRAANSTPPVPRLAFRPPGRTGSDTIYSMTSWTRRHFLAASSTTLLAAPRFSKPLNLQLYTLRDLLPKQPRETLAEVARIGYASVEPGRAQLAKLAPICRELKLTTPSVHIETPLVTGSYTAWPGVSKALTLAAAIDESKNNGAKFLVVSYLQKAERSGGLDFFRKFADQMNQAGETCAKSGLQLCYHHHSFEFEPTGGQRPFDILVERFDKRSVQFQVDLFWLTIGGNDAAAMLAKLKGRVASVHMKDIAPGTKTEYWEGAVPKGAFQEVGSGSLDWARLLPACDAAGVRQYVIEQDQCAGSPLDSIAKSYKFLRSNA